MGAQQTKGLDYTKQIQWTGFSGVQGSVNTFKEITIQTGVTPQGGYGLRITDLEVDFSLGLAASQTGLSIQIMLSKESGSAMKSYDDKDVLGFYRRQMVGSVTTSGGVSTTHETPIEIPFNGEILVVEPQVYLGFTTFGASAVVTVTGRIFYEQIPLSEIDILRILQG